jgi:Predicted membrane protein (DUF2306)
MIKTTVISPLLALVLWAPVLFFSLLLTHNAMLYFTHGGEYGILPEKLIARLDPLWNIAFYIHLPTGVLCLLTPVFLLSKSYFKKLHQLHQSVGKVYVFVTLLLVCPTGMYLAVYAKGGIITQVGFMIQGILLGVFTYNGYRAALNGNKSEHVRNMVRSYAVATVVLTFRILHIMFFLLKVPYADNYAISQWLGLSANLLLAELFIALKDSHKKTFTIKSQHYEIY